MNDINPIAINLMKIVFDHAEREAMLRAMSNQELANLLIEYVWSDIDIDKPQSALISVIADRLQGEHEK